MAVQPSLVIFLFLDFLLGAAYLSFSSRDDFAEQSAIRRSHPTRNLQAVIKIPASDNAPYYYQYESHLLPLPDGVAMEHAHGIHISDDDSRIIITYQDKMDDSKCLLQWSGDLAKPATFLGPGSSLCAGNPHGLTAIVDEGETFLYHANNDQHLSKTRTDGTVLWTHQHTPPDAARNTTFKPTWISGQPDSPYIYLADGYGSSRIYQMYKHNGTYTGRYFGGTGTDNGYFQTSHGLSWDWRFGHLVVSDRENYRLQYFRINPLEPYIFDYLGQQSFVSKNLFRPCNIRFHPTTQQAIIPFLEGNVGIYQRSEKPFVQRLEGILNISQQMGSMGFLHPHDAHFLSNGDFVLVTWNPGRIGYFRKVVEYISDEPNDTVKIRID